jgi:hypothetical protein
MRLLLLPGLAPVGEGNHSTGVGNRTLLSQKEEVQAADYADFRKEICVICGSNLFYPIDIDVTS